MDLVLLITIIIGGILLFYLTETIRSLQKEVREMKLKCINTTYNGDTTPFKENTGNPDITITENMVSFLLKAKKLFDNKNT